MSELLEREDKLGLYSSDEYRAELYLIPECIEFFDTIPFEKRSALFARNGYFGYRATPKTKRKQR